MPAGYDAEVAELFRDLRAASGLSEADLAAQLATRLEVVQALEQGALFALPPWPETYRVVATYGTLLNLDVRPLLRRIYAQVEAGIVELAPKPMPDVPFMAPPDGADRQPQGRAGPPAPPATEGPVQPRRATPPQPGAPKAAPDRRASPQQAQAPQQRQQPRPQPPPQQQPGQWPPQPRGAPPHLRPQAPQPRPQAPQPPQWPPQPQGAPPQPRAAPPLQPRATPAPQPQPQAPVEFQPRVAHPTWVAAPEPKPAGKGWPRLALLKWGVAALFVLGAAFGLWMWLATPGPLGSGPASQPGAKSSQGAKPSALDPDDPRSRKADRLPGPS